MSRDSVVTITAAKNLTTFFHNTYERLAPLYGYQTREDTKQFDPESPNGKLMVAVATEVLFHLKSLNTPAPRLEAPKHSDGCAVNQMGFFAQCDCYFR